MTDAHDTTPDTFGAVLRHYRDRAGLSQEELAEHAGLTGKAIGALERGERKRPYPATVRSLAEALGLSAEERAALLALVPSRGEARAHRPADPLFEHAPPATVESGASAQIIPDPVTPLIGRKADVAVVCSILRDGARLVTLTGPGGVGKTRLALQVAREAALSFAYGVRLVLLAPLADDSLVLSTIAHALGVRETGGQPVAELLRSALQGKQVLLLLDNCEHLLEGMADLATVLEGCPQLAVLATSRTPLRLRGEHEYPVSPLALPTFERALTPDEALESPAVQLFLDRARASSPRFRLTPENASAVAAICGRLDGLPLALELAAPRIKLVPPAALLARLHRVLPLLTGGARDMPARQQTLRATLDWSYSLLRLADQALFAGLGVFAGPFDAASAAAVCGDSQDMEPTVMLERLAALADQSLLAYVSDESGVRFQMLQTVWEYAAARLAESEDADDLRRRHAEHFLHLAEEAEPHLTGPDQMAWMRCLDREVDNLRAALTHLLDSAPEDALRLATLLDRYWGRRGSQAEGRYWLDAALERVPAPQDPHVRRLRAKALVINGVITADVADFDRADRLLAEALTIYESLQDQAGLATTLDAMGEPALLQGDLERSRAYREQALMMHRQAGNRWGMADALRSLAQIALSSLDIERGALYLRESVALFEQLGDQYALSSLLPTRAAAAFLTGEAEEALALTGEAVRTRRELGDEVQMAEALLTFSVVVAALGDKRRAARIWGAGEAALRRFGIASPDGFRSSPAAAPIRAVLQDPAYGADVEAGHALSLIEATETMLGAVTVASDSGLRSEWRRESSR